MKYICFLFFLFLVETGIAQELRTAVYPDGKLRYKGYFKGDEPCGELLRYYPDGKIKAKMIHRGDSVDAVLYSPNGENTSSGLFIGRKKAGIWEYRKGNMLIASEEYVNNLLQGTVVRYFTSGKPAEKKSWMAGKPQGAWILYYNDGKTRMEAAYLAGKLNGEMKSFDANGNLRTQGEYKNDLKEGVWHFYDREGKIQKEMRYLAGIPENAEQEELQESRQLDTLINSVKQIPDPAAFADDPEMYMKITGEKFPEE